jgi:arylsulfatase A-like enzyme
MEPGEFEGTIRDDFDGSVPWWPERRRPAPGSPNVVLVVLDDVGFAQLGCFGSDIHTPVIDRLSGAGLQFTNFHTTALCSPTRSCLLTGRNHHSNGMGRVVELATGFPGYDATIARANGFLSQILVDRGYATWAVGKWHLAPEDECHLAAPRHNWPLGRGFERFYGFLEGETHQFVPALVSDNHQVLPPGTYEDGYHLTEDLVDTAIGYVSDLRAVDCDKPFFLYLCPGACHSPHQAPRSWIDRYAGRFDRGWDAWRETAFARQLAEGILPGGTELSARPDWVPAWDSLSDDTRRLYARYMEAFAGFLSHTDDQLGRLVDFLDRTGDLDNTILLVLSDNGASSEGGPTGSVNDIRPWNMAPRSVEEALGRIDEIGGPLCHNNYPWGWTVAGNTPFRRWKREVHEGGVADPLIVHWPAGTRGEDRNRNQYVHAIDVFPTVLELLGIDAPDTLAGVAQAPVHGTSFAEVLADPDAPDRHLVQYYEMFGCRALYLDGWKAVTYHPVQDTSVAFVDDEWELYHVAVDPSECHDLAADEPERLAGMVGRWWDEARTYGVLPLDNRPFSDLVFDRPRPVPERSRYVYYPGAAAVPEMVAVNVRNRSHRIVATVDIPDPAVGGAPAEGVLVALGSGLGGWTFYLADGRPAYAHNFVSLEEHHIEADEPVPPGRHEVAFRFERTGEHRGVGHLEVDGVEVARGEIPRFTLTKFSVTGAGLTCGYSDGLPVTRRYEAPFRCTGTIERIVIDVDGPPWVDPETEAEEAMARQ